jgi:hypothetical protein
MTPIDQDDEFLAILRGEAHERWGGLPGPKIGELERKLQGRNAACILLSIAIVLLIIYYPRTKPPTYCGALWDAVYVLKDSDEDDDKAAFKAIEPLAEECKLLLEEIEDDQRYERSQQ